MPNRILKESICTSDNLDTVSPEAEVFFYRLMVQVDDYGCYDARLPILRSRCYPLRPAAVTEEHIKAWLMDLVGAGLVEVYSVNGRPYVHLVTWADHQQIRAHRRKFPGPESADSSGDALDALCYQSIADASRCPRNPIQSNPTQSESKGNPVNSRPQKRPRVPPTSAPPAVETFRQVTGRYPPKAWFGKLSSVVGNSPEELSRWQDVCLAWVGEGWKATNVAGMLQFFERHEIPPGPTRANGTAASEPAPDRGAALEHAARKLGYVK
jgi:hypothetical protein